MTGWTEYEKEDGEIVTCARCGGPVEEGTLFADEKDDENYIVLCATCLED